MGWPISSGSVLSCEHRDSALGLQRILYVRCSLLHRDIKHKYIILINVHRFVIGLNFRIVCFTECDTDNYFNSSYWKSLH